MDIKVVTEYPSAKNQCGWGQSDSIRQLFNAGRREPEFLGRRKNPEQSRPDANINVKGAEPE